MTLVRPAGPEDAASMLRVIASSPEAGTWNELRLDPPRVGFVAVREEEIIAVLLADSPIPDEAEILTLAVAPAARRQGVAGALLRKFLASRKGRVYLEVRPSNAAARGLYARAGFVERGRRQEYYQSPREDALVMELVIS